MLEITGLSAWYGEAQALREVSLRASPGEVVTLVGRNGAGKSTLLRCLMGLHAQMTGSVRLGERDLGPLGPVRRVHDAFPALRARRQQTASKLSGGEQQMLAIARVLRMGARVLLLDEPTEGLAPILVQQIARLLVDAKADALTILLVEQNLRFATSVADRHYLLGQGEIVTTLANDEVKAREHELRQHLGI